MRAALESQGADEAVIEQQLTAEFGQVAAAPITVFEDHWRAIQLFEAVCGQFERNPMNGHLLRLRYEAVDVVIRYRPELTPAPDDFEKLQLIERIVIQHGNQYLQSRDKNNR